MDPETGEERRQGEQRQRVRRAGGDRRLGRPSFEETSQTSVRMPGALHDRLVQCAARRDADVSVTHRLLLEIALTVEERLFASQNQ